MALTASLAATDKAIRQAEPGEAFEAVDGPALDEATGVRRIRVACADGGGAVAWATVRGKDGETLLEAV